MPQNLSFKNTDITLHFTEGNYNLKKIVKVTTYKKDLITIDLICLHIYFEDGESLVLYEEMQGWNKFITLLNTKLKISGNWHENVMCPAFQENEIIIYRK